MKVNAETIEKIILDFDNWSWRKPYLPKEIRIDQWMRKKNVATELIKYIEDLQNLLRFDDCPELLIENPSLIKGKEPSKNDIEWAKTIISRHENKPTIDSFGE